MRAAAKTLHAIVKLAILGAAIQLACYAVGFDVGVMVKGYRHGLAFLSGGK